MSDPARYAGWYASGRGKWIGEKEFALLDALAQRRANDTLLDVGCGTGYFTDCFAQQGHGSIAGLDPNVEWLAYAAQHARTADIAWVGGRGEALPFADRSFDIVVSVTALCFIADQTAALREMLRVSRRRIVLGLLNRHSILWYRKGRGGGSGSYRGAYWHGVTEARLLLGQLGAARVDVRTAVFLPGGGPGAQWLETHLSNRLPWGSFLAVGADVDKVRVPDAPYGDALIESEAPWPSQRL